VPDFTLNVSASLALRLAPLGENARDGLRTALPGLSVDATVPVVPSPCVVKSTPIVSGAFATGPDATAARRRAPAPSIVSVTVVLPFQCGVIVRCTEPTRRSTRSASTS
jgi:hypothetical protein